MNEIAELPPKESAIEVYQKQSGLDPYIERIRKEVTGHVPDLTTKKGRDAIASLAFKVRKSKTALDALGKQLVDDLKDIPKRIDAERKRMRDQLDALADEVRAPLDAWEKAEQERINGHKDAIDWLRNRDDQIADLSAADIEARIHEVEAVEIGKGWEEFEAEAARTKDAVLLILRTALVSRQKHEAEQAELARLRAEAAEREQKEREARIAQEAEERAKREAEAKAQAEREATARREAEARAAAERRELELKLQAEKAERERLEAIQRAEKEKADAIARAEQEKRDAEERQRQAVEAERKRQADEQARIEAEAKAREADRANKSKVMRAAKEGLMKAGITEDQARAAVKLIAAGEVPNVRIHF